MSYTIFMLPEDVIVVTGTTGGNGLDGVDQGDGRHLVGAMITLSDNNWQAIEITDDDANFQDNDGGQRLINSETVNGFTHPPGTIVEAEYSFTVTDPSGNSYTLVAFNFRDSSPSYGTVEGLAFLGDPGGFPPLNVTLTVTSASEGPSFGESTYATPLCFASGTCIDTPDGPRRIEELFEGDLVTTNEAGALPVLWHGRSRFAAIGARAPILFHPGAIGNVEALRVSRQHRLRVTGWRAELYFGEEAVWIPAAHFVDGRSVVVDEGGFVTYHHLMLEGHRTLFAEGVEAESFLPGKSSMAALGPATLRALHERFPDLMNAAGFGLSHPALRQAEARVLLAA